jgi:hypothetical protein
MPSARISGNSMLPSPRARVVLLDNRYVEGSSTPVSEPDAHGNTYQLRRLADATEVRVLKNFPSKAQLRGLWSTV